MKEKIDSSGWKCYVQRCTLGLGVVIVPMEIKQAFRQCVVGSCGESGLTNHLNSDRMTSTLGELSSLSFTSNLFRPVAFLGSGTVRRTSHGMDHYVHL